MKNGILYLGGQTITLEYPNENVAQKGMLKRIIYPTGGYTEFTFESNKYTTNRVSSPDTKVYKVLHLAGGLRIRDITHFNGDSLKAVSQKHYK